MDDRGQALPLVAVVVVLAGALCLASGRLGGAAVARARAVTAADASALAGATAGEEAARQMAAANGARLVYFGRVGADTRVVVHLGAATATARARVETAGAVHPGGAAPALRAALQRAGDLLGDPVPVVTVEAGAAEPSGGAAARHRVGLAVHVPASFVPELVTVAARAGLCRPSPDDHPVHFELCPFRLP